MANDKLDRSSAEPWWENESVIWPGPLGKDWEYLGGLAEWSLPVQHLLLKVGPRGIVVTENRLAPASVTIPWHHIAALHVEGSQQAQARATVALSPRRRHPRVRLEETRASWFSRYRNGGRHGVHFLWHAP